MGGECATGPGWELRLGRWQDVLRDIVTCDAVITDPPYSETTHAGALSSGGVVGVTEYAALSTGAAADLATRWAIAAAGWVVIHTDDILHPTLREAVGRTGRCAFPPVPVLQQMPRVSGDGPGSHGHYLCVSRPRTREYATWGSLPGWYECRRDGSIVRGGKPLDLMRAIVRDYTRPGDLIVDPCAGGGTTLLAAAIEGRRGMGAEMDPATYAKAVRRMRAGHTPQLNWSAG